MPTDLLYGADGDACCTRHYEMTVLDVWPNLIENEGDDVGFHSQEEHITLTDGLFVASCHIHPHFLQMKKKNKTVMSSEDDAGHKALNHFEEARGGGHVAHHSLARPGTAQGHFSPVGQSTQDGAHSDSDAEISDITSGVGALGSDEEERALQACVGEALDPLPPPAPAPAARQPNIQYMWPANNAQVLTAVREPAAAPQQIIDVPMVNLPEGQCLCYVGMINGQELYQVLYTEVPPPYFQFPVPAAPSLSYNSKKRWHNKQQDNNRPYIRKPLNAFMLYMKEHRDLVKAEVVSERRGTAAVNEILGQRWKAMTEEDKEKYFSQSQEEKRLHAQQNPHWSNRDNYGRKIRKRRPARSSDKVIHQYPNQHEKGKKEEKNLCYHQSRSTPVHQETGRPADRETEEEK
ncbi:hypothetical protein F7725_016077 [Dissostichus mawsoni]|uniref:HMG box domain-containing protein n=1 Tax=Dissostichus mawsoni TaxID=36200 RepID=A0A7J5Y5H2_DISMA|nr:hypothetical protein F7725_016077 [Dissostichus mawsoni]